MDTKVLWIPSHSIITVKVRMSEGLLCFSSSCCHVEFSKKRLCESNSTQAKNNVENRFVGFADEICRHFLMRKQFLILGYTIGLIHQARYPSLLYKWSHETCSHFSSSKARVKSCLLSYLFINCKCRIQTGTLRFDTPLLLIKCDIKCTFHTLIRL